MAIKITDECINCGACEPECPNNAIYEGGVEWAISDGTSVKGDYELTDGRSIDANAKQTPISDDVYYISPDKCTECQGFHEEPQCAACLPSRLLCARRRSRRIARFAFSKKRAIAFVIYLNTKNDS
ncbi:MAG: 4Fe-4S binding protein [Chitinophagaceae bacterium]